MAEKCVRVRVPGTSANCGPGFDCLGLACTVYNDLELRLTREPGLSITMTGEGATNIPCDNRNIVWRSAQYLLEKAGKDKEYRGAVIHMENRVPLSRGLGSSATAIVAGLTAANARIGKPSRAALTPRRHAAFKAARRAGAAGATLSGAGPCLIAYVLERRHAEEAVGKAMLEAFRKHDVDARILTLDLDTHGAQILK